MRRILPAVLALTLSLVACNQPTVPQTKVPSTNTMPSGNDVVPPAVSQTEAPPADTTLPGNVVAPPVVPPVEPADTTSIESLGLKPTTYGQTVSVTNGTIKVGQKAMFPFGFYHVSWASDPATRKRDMLEMSSAGFNTMAASVINDDDNAHYGDFLDAAAKARMYVMTEGLFASSIPVMAKKPAVLAWMVADDCNLNFSAEEVRRRSEATRALDATHPTYAALFTTYEDSQKSFFGTSNMMGNMSYPISNSNVGIGSTYDMQRLSVAASTQGGTVPIANLQAFQLNQAGSRMVTSTEIYNMTYQAIGAGIKGILYYTYRDQTNDIHRNPEILNTIKGMVPEIDKISPILLGTQPNYLNTNNGLIHATAWQYQGHTYLLLTNVSPTQTQPLYVPMATYAPSMLKLMFAARTPNQAKLNGTILVGNIAPLAAHFYQIN